MSRFLAYLNVPMNDNTPMDVIQGGQLIDGLQMIYEDLNEGSKKDMMASTIANMAQILMRRINEIKGITNPKVEEELKEAETQKTQEQRREYKQDVKDIKNRPDPVQDKKIDEVDPPIENGGNPTPPSPEDTDLQDLINTIHNLEF